MNKIKYLLLIPIFCMSLALCAQEGLKQPSMNFTGVAKKAIPAVVSIQVKSTPRKSRVNIRGQEFDYDDQFNFFNDNFFNQFFGAPKRENRQPKQRQTMGQASGFIISDDGLILTNNHVVDDADEIHVVLTDGKEFDAELIGKDPNTDLALIKIDGKDLPHLKLGNSDNLEIGQWVMAVGNPLGLQASVTVGVVSATGRNNLDIARIEDFIQTDAAINRGNSGGPLLNIDGDVIGINTAIVSNMGSGGYMGIGFAIPSSMAQYVMEELLNNGSIQRGFLGVTLQKVDQDLATAFGLNRVEGALVSDVQKNSPASNSGIKQGDVIIEFNNKTVSDIAQVKNSVSLMKPGTAVTLTILRHGKSMKIPVKVGEFPEDGGVVIKTNKLGIEVENLSPEIARNLNYLEEKGVVVTKVDPNSVASWAGIKKGALIVSVNQKLVSSIDEFNHSLKESDPKKPLLLLIKQGDYMRYVSLKVN